MQGLWLIAGAAAACALPAVMLLTGRVRRYLIDRAILDVPGERSSHTKPTPRGAGLAVIPIVLLAFAALNLTQTVPAGRAGWIVIVGTAVLAFVSWLDDRRGLNPVTRLIAQLGWVVVGLFTLPPPGLIFQGVFPYWLDWAIAAALWLWFINAFNFMDGIDGIAGAQTASIGVGLALLALVAPALFPFGALGLVLVGAAVGFLVWNWQPARIFLGDVGSVPLGYLLGWLLLGIATQGAWAAALILPAYYLGDATLTLVLRLFKGEKVWQAHREHFYQRAVRGGMSHRSVVLWISLINLGLIGLAFVSVGNLTASLAALGAAALIVAVLLWYFARALRIAIRESLFPPTETERK
jgi:UDP-N-acetylmuramyl pentapeptide phosphotransferase/UDP-N-acetylglucosamine-1-phosphate transferase